MYICADSDFSSRDDLPRTDKSGLLPICSKTTAFYLSSSIMDRLTRELLAAETSATDEISPRQRQIEELADAETRRLSSTRSYSQQHHLSRTRTGAQDSHLDPVELNRIYTYRLQHAATIGSRQGVAPREQWLPLGAGKPYPPSLPEAEEYVVEFTGPHDSLHPHNWPLRTKYVQRSMS